MKQYLLGLLCLGSLFFMGCNDKVNDETAYNQKVVMAYSTFINSLRTDMQIVSQDEDSILQSEAKARLSRITDSCIEVMKQLNVSEEAKDYHLAVNEVYNEVKYSYIPALNEALALKKTDSIGEDYNKAVATFSEITAKVDQLQANAIKKQKEYVKRLDQKLQ